MWLFIVTMVGRREGAMERRRQQEGAEDGQAGCETTQQKAARDGLIIDHGYS
jgi:hypothetical protein